MLTVDSLDGVLRLTLSRAERGNALSAELVEALIAAIEQSTEDATLHTLLFASDSRHFCTGFDMGGIAESSDGDLLLRFVRIEYLLQAIARSPLRTVCVAGGRTWGAGADLFCACDTRIAKPDSTFRFPGAAFGIVLGSRRLSTRVGPRLAFELTTTGAELDAAAALRSGLATEVSADEPTSYAAFRVSRETAVALRSATSVSHDDHDLAAVVRSASKPGLRQRITQYLAATRPGK